MKKIVKILLVMDGCFFALWNSIIALYVIIKQPGWHEELPEWIYKPFLSSILFVFIIGAIAAIAHFNWIKDKLISFIKN